MFYVVWFYMTSTSTLEPRTELLQTTVEKSVADAIRERARVAERSVAAELRLLIREALDGVTEAAA